MEYIREQLPTPELLAQLAEEAAELGHAALKLRRVYDGTNPTPKTYEEALGDLIEEIADVNLLLDVLGMNNLDRRIPIMEKKLTRWERRLRKNGRKQEAVHDPARVIKLEAELATALKHIAAQKECCTCKHKNNEALKHCTADCVGDCKASDCVCRNCYNGSKWEWIGVGER